MSEPSRQSPRANETNKEKAAQPKPPADGDKPPADGKRCDAIQPTIPPKLKDLDPCKEPCNCPPGSNPESGCTEIEKLIGEQGKQILAAKKAETFKTELEGLLNKAKTASQEYSQTKYESLRRRWVDQDAEIAELIYRLVCSLDCWRCVIECTICPHINLLVKYEKELYRERPIAAKEDSGQDPAVAAEVYNLYEQQYWHMRDKEKKERTFNRIKLVLAAWEKPAQTIEKILTDNAKLIADISKLIGTEPGNAIYDVFFKLVPQHLAIAPPSNSEWMTKINKEYTEFCKCDKGTPDDCCGPDVGEWTVLQRLIGPQPYLIEPKDYYTVICCLVMERYSPAKTALAEAEAALSMVDEDIKKYKTHIENQFKQGAFEKEVKKAITGVIDCGRYQPKQDTDSDCS